MASSLRPLLYPNDHTHTTKHTHGTEEVYEIHTTAYTFFLTLEASPTRPERESTVLLSPRLKL